jgi:hypothetical protein
MWTTILNGFQSELLGKYDRDSLSNELLNIGGGGIEKVSPSTAVSEMLMQSHERA